MARHLTALGHRRFGVLSFLRGFGPATVQGIQTWSGLTRLRPLVEAMEADWELARLTGPDGEELFDLEGLDLTDADAPCAATFLAPYDNVIVAQADRRRIADDEAYAATWTPNGRSPGFLLVDGFLAGTWRIDADGVVTGLRMAVDGNLGAPSAAAGWTR